jgi:hypothetical protein
MTMITKPSSSSNTGERMAILETKVDTVLTKLDNIEKRMAQKDLNEVTRREFDFLKNVVYSGIGIVLTSVLIFAINKLITGA